MAGSKVTSLATKMAAKERQQQLELGGRPANGEEGQGRGGEKEDEFAAALLQLRNLHNSKTQGSSLEALEVNPVKACMNADLQKKLDEKTHLCQLQEETLNKQREDIQR